MEGFILLKKSVIVLMSVLFSFVFIDGIIVEAENINELPKITLNDGSIHEISAVDEEITEDLLNIFTPEYGTHTKAFDDQTIQAIIVNNIVVDKFSTSENGTMIPNNGFVLSGNGESREVVENLHVGETIQVSDLNIFFLPEKYFTLNEQTYAIDFSNSAREQNQIVVYDSSYGERTSNNQWGLEFAIVNNEVTEIRSLGEEKPLFIPSDGLVISIHNEELVEELSKQIEIGTNIEVVLDNVFVYNATRISYDAFNPSVREDNPEGWDDANDEPFPGFRGADQVIVYNHLFGEATGTNSHGFEFVVDSNGVISSVGGNNNIIPEEGLVISGHGTAVSKLMSAGTLSSKVTIDEENSEILIISTPALMLNRATNLIEQETVNLEKAKKSYKDVDYLRIEQYLTEARLSLTEAEEAIEASDFITLKNAVEKVVEETDNAYFTNFESRQVESRAVWMRPTETTRVDVRDKIIDLKEAGINSIYLETSDDTYTIYPSVSPYVSLNPAFNDQDMLQIYIEEAHKLGVEIHAWYKTFMVEPTVIEGSPEWAMETREGEKTEPGTGFSWISPAHPEARDYIMTMINQLINDYDIDGFQLDYIRYPEADMGYEQKAVKQFENEHNIDPRELVESDPLWNQWVTYREDLVNTMVYEIVDSIREVDPSIEVSTSVFADYEAALVEKMQNPKDWIEKGYIDTLFPMSYSMDLNVAVKDMESTITLVDDATYIAFGVGSFIDISTKDLITQMNAVNGPTEGTGIFEAASFLNKGYGSRASQGLYRRPAITPRKDLSLSVATILEDINRKIDDIYITLNGMDHRSANPIKAQINNLIKRSENPEKITKRLQQIADKVEKDDKIDQEVVSRILTDLDYIQRLIKNH